VCRPAASPARQAMSENILMEEQRAGRRSGPVK
jgi:hypothetical protein